MMLRRTGIEALPGQHPVWNLPRSRGDGSCFLFCIYLVLANTPRAFSMSSQRNHSSAGLRLGVLLVIFGWILMPSPALAEDDDHNMTTSEVRRFLKRARVDKEKIDDFITRYRDGDADEN